MDMIVSFVKRYPLPIFFILTLIFSWSGWVFGIGQIAFGPLLSGLIVVPIISGRSGLKNWLSRIVRWRVGLVWYLAAIFIPVMLVLATVLINIMLGAPTPTPAQLAAWPELLPTILFVFFYIALGEEPGFRGFALPRLQEHRSALLSTLILAAYGVLWHLPLFVLGGEPVSIIFVIIGGYVLMSWVYNNTDGSVLLVMIMHTAVNAIGPGYFGRMFSGADASRYFWILAILYLAAGSVVVAAAGPERLSRSHPLQTEASMD
jgi:membrane protease YdiL (CAAX protease family)